MMGFWKRLAVSSTAVLGLLAAAVAQDSVGLGDAAPGLDVLEWVKGDAVDLAALKGKNVVVLDIFTVNDTRLPGEVKHLNTLQEKHAAAGLKVVGLGTDPVDDVKAFVAKTEFKYAVGVDNLRNTVGTYGRGQPPLTAIIDKEGRLVWRGYVARIDQTLEKVLAGTYDLEAVKKTQALEMELMRQMPTNDPDLVQPAADALLAQNPANMNGIHARKFCFAKKSDAKGFREWIVKHVPKVKESDTLNAIAWELATTDDLEWREPAAALAAAKAAVEATQGKEAAIIDTLARVYSEVGLLDRAVEEQKRAIAALPADTDEDDKKRYQATLAYYESCSTLAKAEKPAPKADPKTPPKKK